MPQNQNSESEHVVDEGAIALFAGWVDFVGGNWTREPPVKPGLYPIADELGLDAGHLIVGSLHGKILYNGKEQCRWHGWFWSEPLPPMPPAPPMLDNIA